MSKAAQVIPHAEVLNNLGVMMIKGMGTDVDQEEGMKCLRIAAKTFSSHHAVHNLDLLELLGVNVPKKKRKKRWEFENALSEDLEVRFVEDRFNRLRSDLVFSSKFLIYQ